MKLSISRSGTIKAKDLVKWLDHGHSTDELLAELRIHSEEPPPCECCGKPGPHSGITLLKSRTICETCFYVWYDMGLVDPKEIGEVSKKWQADPDHWSHCDITIGEGKRSKDGNG